MNINIYTEIFIITDLSDLKTTTTNSRDLHAFRNNIKQVGSSLSVSLFRFFIYLCQFIRLFLEDLAVRYIFLQLLSLSKI